MCDIFALHCEGQPIDFGVAWIVLIPLLHIILAFIVFALCEYLLEKNKNE